MLWKPKAKLQEQIWNCFFDQPLLSYKKDVTRGLNRMCNEVRGAQTEVLQEASDN